MNMIFKRKLIIPQELKEMYPVSETGEEAKKANDESVRAIFTGESDKLLQDSHSAAHIYQQAQDHGGRLQGNASPA